MGEYFDSLLTKVYQYQSMGQYYICGDFNSRLGDLVDYIEGVDDVPPRDVLDFSKNAHGQYFCNFLIDSNCCILNGRVDSQKMILHLFQLKVKLLWTILQFRTSYNTLKVLRL